MHRNDPSTRSMGTISKDTRSIVRPMPVSWKPSRSPTVVVVAYSIRHLPNSISKIRIPVTSHCWRMEPASTWETIRAFTTYSSIPAVENGQMYYYAVTAYDHGDATKNIFPAETPKSVLVDEAGNVTLDINTTYARPIAPAAGYVPAHIEPLTHVSGSASGLIFSEIVDGHDVLDGASYQVSFIDSSAVTIGYNVIRTYNGSKRYGYLASTLLQRKHRLVREWKFRRLEPLSRTEIQYGLGIVRRFPVLRFEDWPRGRWTPFVFLQSAYYIAVWRSKQVDAYIGRYRAFV